ncbi:MAG: SAM-dependent methyltransferase [Phycisphaerales bacterium]
MSHPPKDATLARSVARSLGVPTRYAHLVPVLFQTCENLGSSPEPALEMLRRAGIGPNSRVLELACGLGATAVGVAADLGARVRAVDGCPAFVELARAAAKSRGVARTCTFEAADVRSIGDPRPTFDASLMVGHEGHEHAAPLLRAWTRPGGLYVFDDAILRELGTPRTVVGAFIRSLGDAVEAFQEFTTPRLRRQIASDLKRLAEGVERASAANPRLRRGLHSWFAQVTQQSATLPNRARAGLWLVRRSR